MFLKHHYLNPILLFNMKMALKKYRVNISTVHIQYPEKLKYEAYVLKINITAVTFTYKT